MNAWMNKMTSWRGLIATTVNRWKQAPRAGDRNYWDRQSRAWSGARRESYAWQRAEPANETRRRPR